MDSGFDQDPQFEVIYMPEDRENGVRSETGATESDTRVVDSPDSDRSSDHVSGSCDH